MDFGDELMLAEDLAFLNSQVGLGFVEGTIAESPRGSQGFGLDCNFIPNGGELTSAEMSGAEKHRIPRRLALEELKSNPG